MLYKEFKLSAADVKNIESFTAYDVLTWDAHRADVINCLESDGKIVTIEIFEKSAAEVIEIIENL